MHLLLRDRFPVLDQSVATAYRCLVIHGTADEVVPSSLSAQVAADAPQLVEKKVLPGVGHNDAVMFGSEVSTAVVALVDHLEEK